jgi:hypothetical protein
MMYKYRRLNRRGRFSAQRCNRGPVNYALMGAGVASNVSTVNPIPWPVWLKENCEVRGSAPGVTFWGTSNCNYIVFKGFVFCNYGYHGRVLFRALRSYRTRSEKLRELDRLHKEVKAILDRPRCLPR